MFKMFKSHKNEKEPEQTESDRKGSTDSDSLCIPWEEFAITDSMQQERMRKKLEKCDSCIEIPWEEILLDPKLPTNGRYICDEENADVPWDDLLIPRNVRIKPTKSRKKHRSCCRKAQKNSGKHCCSLKV